MSLKKRYKNFFLYFHHFISVFIPNETGELKITDYSDIKDKYFFGIDIVEFTLTEVNESQFKNSFLEALTEKIVLFGNRVPKKKARELVEIFLDLFQNPRFYTNADPAELDKMFSEKDIYARDFPWIPQLGNAYDIMVVAVDSNLIGIILVYEDD